MATQLGSNLTRALTTKIRSKARSDSNEVVFLISVDVDGFPHVALIGFQEMFVMSDKHVLFAIGASSVSKKNLTRTKKGTLVFWGGKNSGMYYVKGRVKTAKNVMNAAIEGIKSSALILTVEKVSQDYSKVAKLISTVIYDATRVRNGHKEIQKELQFLSATL